MPKWIAPLTDTRVRPARPQKSPQKIYDGGGLFLLVTPSGGKLWKFKYRFKGKEKKLSFGGYPDISLAAARQQRGERRSLQAHGESPGLMDNEYVALSISQMLTIGTRKNII